MAPTLVQAALTLLLAGPSAALPSVFDVLQMRQNTLVIPPKLPGSWTSQGCYKDVGRTLGAASYSNNTAMTDESCIMFCDSLNFIYAGTEYSEQCFCDNTIASGGVSEPTSDCQMACSGDSSEPCGGPNRLNLFWSGKMAPAPPAVNPGPKNWTSLGCYVDNNGGRTLSVGMSVPGGASNMTVANCVEACWQGNYAYAGVEYAQECYCDNSIFSGGSPAPLGDCNALCKGNSSEFCGSGNRLNLYELSALLTTSSSSSSAPVTTSSTSSTVIVATTSSTTTSSSVMSPTSSSSPAAVMPTSSTSATSSTASSSASSSKVSSSSSVALSSSKSSTKTSMSSSSTDKKSSSTSSSKSSSRSSTKTTSTSASVKSSSSSSVRPATSIASSSSIKTSSSSVSPSSSSYSSEASSSTSIVPSTSSSTSSSSSASSSSSSTVVSSSSASMPSSSSSSMPSSSSSSMLSSSSSSMLSSSSSSMPSSSSSSVLSSSSSSVLSSSSSSMPSSSSSSAALSSSSSVLSSSSSSVLSSSSSSVLSSSSSLMPLSTSSSMASSSSSSSSSLVPSSSSSTVASSSSSTVASSSSSTVASSSSSSAASSMASSSSSTVASLSSSSTTLSSSSSVAPSSSSTVALSSSSTVVSSSSSTIASSSSSSTTPSSSSSVTLSSSSSVASSSSSSIASSSSSSVTPSSSSAIASSSSSSVTPSSSSSVTPSSSSSFASSSSSPFTFSNSSSTTSLSSSSVTLTSSSSLTISSSSSVTSSSSSSVTPSSSSSSVSSSSSPSTLSSSSSVVSSSSSSSATASSSHSVSTTSKSSSMASSSNSAVSSSSSSVASASSSSSKPMSSSSVIVSSGSSSTSSSATRSSSSAAPTLQHVPSVGNYKWIGCYTEATNVRALNLGTLVDYKAMTVEMCAGYCTPKYSMFGLEYSGECYCGNSLQPGSVLAPTTDCNDLCDGNPYEYCGQGNRLDVYQLNGASSPASTTLASTTSAAATTSSTTAATTSTIANKVVASSTVSTTTSAATSKSTGWTYAGCYIDGQNGRILPADQENDNQANSVETCISECSAKGYTIAGMEYGTQCFCDNALYNGATLANADTECSFSCPGKNAEFCGAGNRMSVYYTGTLTTYKAPAPLASTGNWTYQGCYSDNVNNVRALFWQNILTNNNTAETCLGLCAQYGYMAGGMEYGDECYCGDTSALVASGSTKQAESDCAVPCSGNSLEICGGGSRLSYYTWTGTPLYTWHTPTGSGAGQYELLIGGVVVPLITTLGTNNKVTFLEKHGTGAANSTGAYELDLSEINNFDAAWRTMTGLQTDVFCSAGLTLPDKVGRQINIGGWSGESTYGVRIYWPDGSAGVPGTNEWIENYEEVSLQAGRWYPSAVMMANGSILVVGGEAGSNSAPTPSLEILPNPPGGVALYMDWLARTDPNNLYPFLYVLPTGGIFVGYWNEARILDEKTFATTKTLPNIPGSVNNIEAGRTYPLEGTSMLLPQYAPFTDHVTIIICGGSSTGASLAIDNCVTTRPEDESPTWTIERMPSQRVMSCMVALPDGTYLILNGAQQGVAGFGLGQDPNLGAVLYDPSQPLGSRMSIMATTIVARLYHSEAILLPDGRVMVSGSDPQDDVHPEEYRVEQFIPPYLLNGLTPPSFTMSSTDWAYGQTVTLHVTIPSGTNNVRVSLMGAVSSTHGNSMGQRTLFPALSCSGTVCTVTAPPNAHVAPPGWFQVFVLDGPTPSTSQWVRIGGDPAGLGNWPNYPDFQPLPGS